MACKPGSVTTGEPAADDHSSGTPVTGRLVQPTRTTARKPACDVQAPRAVPIWPCSRWGLPCRRRYRRRGALLPHPFTLTRGPRARAVCFLWHFPWSHPRRALPGTVLPRSPDFPLPALTGPAAAIRPSDPAHIGHPSRTVKGSTRATPRVGRRCEHPPRRRHGSAHSDAERR